VAAVAAGAAVSALQDLAWGLIAVGDLVAISEPSRRLGAGLNHRAGRRWRPTATARTARLISRAGGRYFFPGGAVPAGGMTC
jgi:hypothetical protein